MKEARGGVSQARHRLWVPFSPLLCVPLPTSTSPALWSLSLKKLFNLEIMSDLQKSYTDSTEFPPILYPEAPNVSTWNNRGTITKTKQ